MQTKMDADGDDDDFGDDFDFAALDKQVEQRLETIEKSDNMSVRHPPTLLFIIVDVDQLPASRTNHFSSPLLVM